VIVGRDAELRELLAAGRAALVAGHGWAGLISGEPGIGKTRLATEVSAVLRAEGVSVAWAGCSPDGGAPPYWPWLQVLRRLGAAHVLAERAQGPGVDPAVARSLLFDEVVDTLCGAGPLLVVLDDLQWADEASLRLLDAVVRQLPTVPVVVLGTYRDTEPEADRLDELVAAERRLQLCGLSSRDLLPAMAELTGETLDPELAVALHRRTGGNPFFAAESVRLLRAEGRLALGGGGRPPLPDSVRAVIERRLARLPADTCDLLGAAALVGAESDVGLLGALSGRPATEVAALLEPAVRARLLTIEQDRYRFVHALVTETVNRQLTPTQRLAWHERAGSLLSVGAARGNASAAGAAHHLLAAARLGGSAPAAVGAARRAAAAAMRRTAYEEAAALLDEALAVMDGSPRTTDERGELLCELGEAGLAVGDTERARRAYLAAVDDARRRDRPDLLASAALGLAGGTGAIEVDPLDPDAAELLREALARLPEGDSALRVMVLARLSVALTFTSPVEHRRALSEQAAAMARRLERPEVLAIALAAHCDAIAGPDHVTARRAAAGEIVELAQGAGNRPVELLGRRLRVVALAEDGAWTAFDAEVAAYARVADRLRQARYTWFVPLWRAMRATMRGDATTAALLAAELDDLVASTGSPNAALLADVARIVRLVGEDRAADAYRLVLPRLDMVPSAPAWGVAFLAARSGRSEEARAMMDEFVAVGLAQPRDGEWLPLIAMAGDAAVTVGHRPGAALAYRLLAPYAGLFAIEGLAAGTWGSVDAFLGRLAHLLGRVDEARTHFAAALDLDAAAGAALAARTRQWAGLRAGPPQPAHPAAGSFRKRGEVWALSFAGSTVSLPDVKGLRDLAVLLGHPGREVHVSELAGGTGDRGDAGPLADRQAIQAYRVRLVELDGELDEARGANDPVRVERAATERDALIAELSAVTGLGGRARAAAAPVERMRKAVTNRIRQSIGRIERVHPALGRHLQLAVRTGTFCSYRPEHPVDWQIRG
jgi:tetratricopeptide (TPR) repeat protein